MRDPLPRPLPFATARLGRAGDGAGLRPIGPDRARPLYPLAIAQVRAGTAPLSAARALALCLVAAAGLTLAAAPRPGPGIAAPEARSVPPVEAPIATRAGPGIRPSVPRFASATTDDLLVVARGALPALEPMALLFPGRGDVVQSLITAAAVANDLPPDFFLRLLSQESGLNPNAVSPAGALGIAQFMPGTAAERGLRDPFDPVEAIPKSAELLREHRGRFGNLGLAAAAYNAGPQRVRDWLDGRSGMPAETRSYVLRITGREIEAWAPPGRQRLAGAMPAISALTDFGFAWASGQAAPSPRRARSVDAVLAPRGAARARGAGREARTGTVRSEQALCTLLNGSGQTCLVRAVY